MSLMSKIATIDASIKAMKTNLGVSENAPLDEVVTATASGGGGGAGTPGVYKVATIEERDAIQAKEGDMCIIHSIQEFQCDGTAFADTLVFPEVIVAPTAITASASTQLAYVNATTGYDVRVMCNISATTFRVMDYGSYVTIAQYTSTDGITFTRTSTAESYTFPDTLKMYGTTAFNTAFTPFLFMRGVVFGGVYIYSSDSWAYAPINCAINPDQIFTPGVAYSDAGKVVGTLDPTRWRKDQIFVQNEEPELKKGLWIKYRDITSFNYSKSMLISTTETDVNAKYTLSEEATDSNAFSFTDACNQNGYFCVTASTPTDTLDLYNALCAVVGDTLYAFYIYHNSNSYQRYCYAINLNTGAKTTKTAPTFSEYGYSIRKIPACNGTYIFDLVRDFDNYVYTNMYNIASNSWTLKKTSIIHDTSAKSLMGFISIDTGTRLLAVFRRYPAAGAAGLYFDVINASTGAVETEFFIESDVDMDSYDINNITTFISEPNFTITNGVLNSADGVISLDLNNITKANVIASIGGLYKQGKYSASYLAGAGYMFDISNSQSDRVFVGDESYYIKHSLQGPSITLYPLRVKNNKLYMYSGANKKIYTLDLSNPLSVFPAYSLVIQTGVGGARCNISEGVDLLVKDAYITNSVNKGRNAVKAIYTGAGSEWVLLKEYED